MRLGKIQKQIVEYLKLQGPNGGYIGSAPNAGLLLGYTREEVERSMEALKRRGIVVRLSLVRHALATKVARKGAEGNQLGEGSE